MKLGSLFDGIGGFPYAARQHGIVTVWASEIETACINITQRHFPGMKHFGDICQIDGANIEPVDIITFGSPCQDLSIAGKRAGLQGERSGLFGEAIRIIDEMREATNGKYPTWAIWENVPGALSSNDGLDFRAVLQAFTNSEIPMPASKRWAGAGMVRGGRCDVAWRTLDAQFWGVPQRRRRVFLVADFAGERAGTVLFKPESLRRDSAPGRQAGEKPTGSAGNSPAANMWPDVARTLAARHDSSPCGDRGQNVIVAGFNGWRSESGTIEYEEERAPCIGATMPPNVVCHDARGYGDGKTINTITRNNQDRITDYTPIVAAFMAGQGAKAGSIGFQEDIAPTLKSSDSGTNQVPAICIQSTTIGRTGDNGADGAGIQQDVSYTLDTKEPHAVVFPIHDKATRHKGGGDTRNLEGSGYRVRRLTPVECERLQGFPDNWTASGLDGKAISDSRRYAAIGNSVAVPCVDYIMAGIAEIEKEVLQCYKK